MKVKISIDDGNGKKAELEISKSDKSTQALLIQSVFELFNVDTSFIEKADKMNKIEKAYAKFMDELNPIEPEKEKLHKPDIAEQMILDFEKNEEELKETYKEQSILPDFVKTGIKIKNGIPHYKLRYECYACYFKDTLYIPQTVKMIYCRKCRHELDVLPATKDGFPSRDSYGNFFISGDYKDWNSY